MVLFDIDCDGNTVQEFLNQLKIFKPNLGDSGHTAEGDIFQACKTAQSMGALVIPAHIDDFSGLSDMSHDNICKLLDRRYINAVQVVNNDIWDNYANEGIAMISNSTNQFREYLTNNFNIIPFATINNYFIALKNHNLSNSTFIYNIFGNLLAFAPFAFFIPRLFNSVDKWSKFFFVTSIFIIIIETMQMITMSGSFDIDDYILNITGANILYIIINNKYLKNYIDSFIHLEYLQ